MQLLPIGDQAAASRLSYLGILVEAIKADTPVVDDRIRHLLDLARQHPSSTDLTNPWTDLHAELHRRMTTATVDADRWERATQTAKYGSRLFLVFGSIAATGAPFCDGHGPMAGRPDEAAPHGTHWWCDADEDCRAGYWWIDGTRFPYR